MEIIKTQNEKVIKIKEDIESYIAFDGKEFSSKTDCARYELANKYNLQKIGTKIDHYEFYTVQNLDELKDMILLDNNCDDLDGLLVIINGIHYKDLSKEHFDTDQAKSRIKFPMTLAQTSINRDYWCYKVSYKTLEKIISEMKELIKEKKELLVALEETLSELSKVKEK